MSWQGRFQWRQQLESPCLPNGAGRQGRLQDREHHGLDTYMHLHPIWSSVPRCTVWNANRHKIWVAWGLDMILDIHVYQSNCVIRRLIGHGLLIMCANGLIRICPGIFGCGADRIRICLATTYSAPGVSPAQAIGARRTKRAGTGSFRPPSKGGKSSTRKTSIHKIVFYSSLCCSNLCHHVSVKIVFEFIQVRSCNLFSKVFYWSCLTMPYFGSKYFNSSQICPIIFIWFACYTE